MRARTVRGAPLMMLAAAALVSLDLRSVAMANPDEPDRGFLEQYAATNHFDLGAPTSITPVPDGSAILFLRSGPRSFVHDLWSFDLRTGAEHRLLTADQVLRGTTEHLSPEEKALRERMRVSARGIVSFRLSDDGRRILAPLAGRLFVIERATGAVKELHGAAGFPFDPQFSPDGSEVACVRNNDLYVTDLASGRERRLTEGGSDTLQHAVAEFVAAEEMDRFRGYWFSPDGRSIAYQQNDLSHVEQLNILDPAHPEEQAQPWRYPRPGKPNADVRLGIMPARGGATRWVEWDRAHYPYLATVRWEANAPLTILVQNRRQTEEALLAVDERHGSTRTLLIERDPAWINLDQKMPVWFGDGSAFLWTSERSGHWALELHARDGHLKRVLTPPGFNLRGVLDVNDRDGVIWATGGDDPTSQQLYRLHLDASREPEQVTSEPGIHSAVFSKDHRISVRSFRDASSLETQTVFGPSGDRIGTLKSLAERPLVTPHLTFTTVGPRGYHAVVIRPSNFVAGRKYPVIVHVYGGPTSQMVVRSERDYLLPQWFADHGFIVVSIDGRGTPSRGREWQRAVKNDLIAIPLADQIEGLRALAAQTPEMDLDHVGIYGWSFGGYFSAIAAMKHPEVFRAGVAGAPVIDWRDYDTHYTERYMDLPETNPRGYEAANVLTYAPKLERPLLLIHGTVDDNVHFLNSMKLSRALFLAGKPFEFLPLAGFTHMVPDPLVTTRLYQRIEQFLEQHVAPPRGEPSAGARLAR